MKTNFLLSIMICLVPFLTNAQTSKPNAGHTMNKANSRQDSILMLKAQRNRIETNNNSKYSDLIPVSDTVLLLSEAIWGKHHPEYADDLHTHGILLWRIGEFEMADSVYHVCKAILEANDRKNTLLYGNLIGNMCSLQNNMGNYPESEQLGLEALNVFRAIGYKDSADYVTTLGNIAHANINMANYEKALALSLEQREGVKKLYGNESLRYALSSNNLGGLYLLLAQFEPAEQLLMEAKQVYEKNGRVKGGNYGMCINNIGLVHYQTGRLESAVEYLERGLEIRKTALGPNHPDYLGSLVNLGLLNEELGKLAEAERYYLEAESGYRNALGDEAPELGVLMGNLAGFYRNVGRFKESSQLFLESLAICKKALGEHHPNYADQIQNYANLLQELGQHEEAKALCRQSLSIYEAAKGRNNIEFESALQNLAVIYSDQDSLEQAEKLQQQSLEICHAIFDSSTENLAAAFVQMGKIRYLQNRLPDAQRCYDEAIRIYQSMFGQFNFNYADCVFDLALCKIAQSDYKRAIQDLQTAGKAYQNLLQDNTEYMTEEESQALLSKFDKNSNECLSTLFHTDLARNDDDFLRFTYGNTLFYKGFLLQSSSARRKIILASSDSSVQRLYLDWLALQRQISKQFALPLNERTEVDSLQKAAGIREKQLLSSVQNLRTNYHRVSWKDVQSALSKGEAAIEIAHFKPSNAQNQTMYGALVLRPGDAAPKFFPLFEAESLKSLLRGASGGSNFLKINELYSQKTLYDLIWKPLEPMLTGINTIYCSPSGLLHRLNLAAIPTPEGQVYGQRRQLVVLGSTRSLAIGTKASQLAVGSSSQAAMRDAYLAGGIRYDSDSTAIVYANRGSTSRNVEPESLAFLPDSLSIDRGGVLDYLPATAAEVSELGQTLKNAGYQIKADTGFNATEESFRELGVAAPSPRIIHLATHGYFFPDPAVSKKQLAIGNEPVFKMSDHPMIRSGLILAGAKQAWLTGKHPDGQEDGILTAYEISQMNLSNTELVVLSACETGLGDIVGNEGVYGLQRAFKIAGAKYLIMSLWKVDDQSTRAFMSAFYRHWLEDKQTVPQAFRSTQQEMRAKYAGAYDWAGFVLIE